MDFVNKRKAFKKFEPNSVRLKNKSYTNLPAGNKQVLGGCYAIWQDNIDKKQKELTNRIFMTDLQTVLLFLQKKTGAAAQINIQLKKWSVPHTLFILR